MLNRPGFIGRIGQPSIRRAGASLLAQAMALATPVALYEAGRGGGWQGTSGGAVAGDGNVTGLIPDLSQMGTQTFEAYIAGQPEIALAAWTPGAGTTSPSNAQLVFSAATSSSYSGIGLENGKVYRLVYTITNYSAGQVFPKFGNSSGPVAAANGTFHYVGNCATGGPWLYFSATGFSGTITITSIKEIPGNHLRAGTWASPSDTARATRGITSGKWRWNFNGSNNYYSLLTPISVTENMTVIRAFRRASAGVDSVGLGSAGALPHEAWTTTTNVIYSRLGSTVRTQATGQTWTGPNVMTTLKTASFERVRLNGVAFADQAGNTDTTSLTALGLRSTNYNNGDISAAAVFDSELTGNALAAWERYIASLNDAVLA